LAVVDAPAERMATTLTVSKRAGLSVWEGKHSRDFRAIRRKFSFSSWKKLTLVYPRPERFLMVLSRFGPLAPHLARALNNPPSPGVSKRK
jgi:hypothetical protein